MAISTACWAATANVLAGRPRVDVDVQGAQDLVGLVVHPPPAHDLSTVAMADEDVLGDAEVGEDHWLLVDGDDPAGLGVGGRAQLDGLTVDLNRPLVGLVDPRHHLDQRRLAGAVLTDEGVHLAGEAT